MAEEATQTPPLPPLPPLPSGLKTRSKSSKSINISPPSTPTIKVDVSFQPGTYIIQVPREQILRVPPSYISEQHRHKMQHGRRRCPSCIPIISIIVLIILILGLAIGVFFLVVRPKFPSFVVESLLIKNPQDKGRKEYGFKLRSYNPSFKMEYLYEGGGNIAISEEEKIVAKGRTPGFRQAPMSSSMFWLKFEGSNLNLSKKITKILLLIQLNVRLKLGGIRVLTVGLETNCDVRVSRFSSTNMTQINSQDCKVKMHWPRR